MEAARHRRFQRLGGTSNLKLRSHLPNFTHTTVHRKILVAIPALSTSANSIDMVRQAQKGDEFYASSRGAEVRPGISLTNYQMQTMKDCYVRISAVPSTTVSPAATVHAWTGMRPMRRMAT
jgi:hypothetical protein